MGLSGGKMGGSTRASGKMADSMAKGFTFDRTGRRDLGYGKTVKTYSGSRMIWVNEITVVPVKNRMHCMNKR